MPELPEITLYVEALERRLSGTILDRIRIRSPSLLRSVDPPITAAHGRTVTGVERLGKRIVLGLEGDLFLVLHLMRTGRLRWKPPGAGIPGKLGHAAFDFAAGTLVVTEAGTKKRASLHCVRGRVGLAAHDRGGIEPLTASAAAFREALLRENRTLKRALTDPRLFSGIGNAHSDEILLFAGLSPVRLTRQLDDAEIERLHRTTRQSLTEWIAILREEAGESFPDKVTAFHPRMAAHGKFGQPCPRCGAPIQRIVYAENETNYCARCQTGGRRLADRALSRLLKQDWPRSLDALEESSD
jgi:formamidopyrimidine-DNA glycosylase